MKVDGNGGSRKLSLKLIPVLALVVCDPMLFAVSDGDSYFIVIGAFNDADGSQVFLFLPLLASIFGAPYPARVCFDQNYDVGIIEEEDIADALIEDFLGDRGLVFLGGGERSCCQQEGGQQYALKESHDA